MTNTAPHFNLYYILKQDKASHALPPDMVAQLWQAVLAATAPPPE